MRGLQYCCIAQQNHAPYQIVTIILLSTIKIQVFQSSFQYFLEVDYLKSHQSQMQIIYLFFLLWPVLLSDYEPIQTFGLLTVTHSRNGDYSVLQKYLERYTMTECYTEFLSEINIVWNNEELPEESKFFQDRDKWKVPVYFFRTTFNSMDHRYRLPKQSTAQLLYSLDDDIIVDCQTFKDTLGKYNQANKKSTLGRVTTNQVRGFGYDPNKGMEFFYQGHAAAIYFTIAEPGAAFIPRHFLDLYYLKLEELQYLHDIVLDVKNCDDIFFWAIVQHFYPQLPAVYVKGQKNYKNTDPKVGQSKTKNVYVIRNKCINNISHALGYNSLRHFDKNSTKYLQNWQYPNLDLILTQKTAGLNQVALTPSIEKQVPQSLKQKLKASNSYMKDDVKSPTPTEKPEVQPPKKPENIAPNLTPNQPIESPVTSAPPQQPLLPEPQRQPQPQKAPQKQQKRNPLPVQTPDSVSQQYLTFSQKVIILLIIIIALAYVLYKLNKRKEKACQLYRIRLQDYDEEQRMNTTSSIRLPDHY